MPNESFIRKEAVKRLHEEGYVVWWPERTASFGSKDIFTVFDLACQRPGYFVTRYIQLTTSKNHAARRRKVQQFIDDKDLMFWAEIWSWNARLETFRIEAIDNAPSMSRHAAKQRG